MKINSNLAWGIILSLLLNVGCAGRAAQPVMVYQHGDANNSCDTLERELELIQVKILELVPQTDKADKNTELGVAGIFLLLPFFFMDLSKAEQIEINALIKRYNHLIDIEEDKHCDSGRQPLPKFEKTNY